ncbi:MAG: DegV family protein [Chloroflexota bacterium]|nr:DegV family protein [Chloroflexota bacterium]
MPQAKRKVSIVTDSTSSMTQAIGREYGVHVIPVYITFGTQTYLDGVDLDSELFYHLLRGSKQLPTTSQPTARDFVELYTTLSKQAEAIVSIHLSHKMSATLDSALAASKQLPDLPIYVIDSLSVSMGLGLITIAAARAAASGQDAAQVVHLVEELIPKTNVIFTVETMEYLHKGGRIGGATALLGSALKIKPILFIKDGQVEPLEKPRTRKRAVGRLLDLVAERVGPSKAVHMVALHCDAPDEVQILAEQVRARFHCVELLTAEAGPIIGTHAGPGTLGVVFYTE